MVTVKQKYRRNPYIIATLDPSLGQKQREACKAAGSEVDRIHSAKMNIPKVIEVIKLDKKAGLDVMVDLPGIKSRTQKTPGMIQPDIPGEQNNWLLPVSDDWDSKPFIFWLVPLSTTDQQMDKNERYVRATIIPQQLKKGDIVVFGDSNITTKVIAISKQGLQGKVLQLEVISVSKESPGIWWKMGLGSTTKCLFSEHEEILSEYDLAVLRAIKDESLQNQVDKVAFSFVSKTRHLDEAVNTLKQFDFDLQKTGIVLKIETIEAIENLDKLSEYTSRLVQQGIIIIYELGRGDLSVDCQSKEMDIQKVQTLFLEMARKWHIPVIIATNVASSTIQANQKGDVVKLSQDETRQINRESSYRLTGGTIVGYMLAAETKIVPHPDKTIAQVRKKLDKPLRTDISPSK